MSEISQKDIDWLVRPKKEFSNSKLPKVENVPHLKRRRILYRVMMWAGLTMMLGIMPFILLIRTSIYLNLVQGWNGWVSLIGGIGATVILLLIYVLILFRKVENKKTMLKWAFGGAGVLVGGFCVYGLLYLSGVHAKSAEIRQVYRSLHPILRVAVATTTLAEDNLLITDISRSAEDYVQMGLPVNQSSLHFKQKTGFVHAIDLRTKGHSAFRNILLELSLKSMGFQTLRHVGTADHLHVALPVNL